MIQAVPQGIHTIDTHSHLNLEPLWDSRLSILNAMRDKGIGTITVGTSFETSQRAVAIAQEHSHCWACVGFHPCQVGDAHYDNDAFDSMIRDDKNVIVAVGECGFDFYHQPKERVYELQKQVFISQIELSLRHDKPLVLHIRPTPQTYDAYDQALEVLLHYPRAHGVVHFFGGTQEHQDAFLEKGFHISCTGAITKQKSYQRIAKRTDASCLMVETDAPYVTPRSYGNQVCDPTMVDDVVAELAQIHNKDYHDMARLCLVQTSRVFGIPLS